MPSRDDILKAFDRINVWSRGSERAPHKPLLVLYALGQLSRGGPNSVAFRHVAPKLTELLKEFGPTRQSYHPEYPFWRLQNDGLWFVDDGFDVRLGSQVMGLEAAHIQWHQAGGTDEEQNGLALCSLHHKAFDLGAFTIHPDRVMLVSAQAHGQRGFDEWLLKFHGRPIRSPQRESYLPAGAYLDWHEREVFKRPPRELL
jgi:predicted restriction endonuclease